jgi:hypothetical protein
VSASASSLAGARVGRARFFGTEAIAGRELVRLGPGPVAIAPMASVDLERVEVLELLAMTLAHLNDAEARREVSPRVPLLMGIRDKLAASLREGPMTYSDAEVSAAVAAIDKHRGGDAGEVGAALAVVGLSAERAAKEAHLRDDLIRVAHRAEASLRQLAEVSGMDRKTVTAIVGVSNRR